MVSSETKKFRQKRPPKPLDRVSLNDLALAYVARFATSSAKLEAYLRRKLRERGVAEDAEPIDVGAIVHRLVELKYVDDEAYAEAKANGLLRRGYGARRVEQALRGAGIETDLREQLAPDEASARHAALSLARRRRFGPFGAEPPDRARQEKQLAAMIRAGHSFDVARKLIEASDAETAEEWAYELDERFD
jgi:regulatory protein